MDTVLGWEGSLLGLGSGCWWLADLSFGLGWAGLSFALGAFGGWASLKLS